jgi:hypothetical protein
LNVTKSKAGHSAGLTFFVEAKRLGWQIKSFDNNDLSIHLTLSVEEEKVSPRNISTK